MKASALSHCLPARPLGCLATPSSAPCRPMPPAGTVAAVSSSSGALSNSEGVCLCAIENGQESIPICASLGLRRPQHSGRFGGSNRRWRLYSQSPCKEADCKHYPLVRNTTTTFATTTFAPTTEALDHVHALTRFAKPPPAHLERKTIESSCLAVEKEHTTRQSRDTRCLNLAPAIKVKHKT